MKTHKAKLAIISLSPFHLKFFLFIVEFMFPKSDLRQNLLRKYTLVKYMAHESIIVQGDQIRTRTQIYRVQPGEATPPYTGIQTDTPGPDPNPTRLCPCKRDFDPNHNDSELSQLKGKGKRHGETWVYWHNQ